MADPQLINGRYQVIERVGKGAMGVVYKAHDPVLDRVVAIKEMAADVGDDPQLRQRFNQEARAAARLNHRHIVTIHELEESEGEIYIVMELLEGVDLATIIKRQVPLPLGAKLNIMAQVCDGLEYAHRKGIVHRDIKPANLFVAPDGVVKILDFGIARLVSSKMTSTGGLIGTPDYMSPEQVMAANVDARSDLFAVGAVTYQLLSGRKPFEAESVTALLMKIVREPHVPLRERAPRLPKAAIDLVERLLQKTPADRPQTAQEVREALLAIPTDQSPLDAATVAILSTAVAEETLRPRTPVPPTRKAAPPASRAKSAGDSEARLASLAIERGRSLRESGDLGGAMKVFRSVLEISPGNAEALAELEELERVLTAQSASRLGSAVASPPADTLSPPPVATIPPPAVPTMPAPATRKGMSPAALVAAAIIAVAAIGGVAGMWVWLGRDEPPGQSAPAPADSASAPAQPAPPSAPSGETAASSQPLTPVAVTPTGPVVTTPPATAPTPGPSLVPSPVTPPRPSEPAPKPQPARPETVGATPLPSPTPVAPVTVLEPPPKPASPVATPPAAVPTVTIRHLHGRSIFRGRFKGGYCEGTLELLPDGLRYTAVTTTDNRADNLTIKFAEIEGFELDGQTLAVETSERNLTFTGAKDVLTRIEQLIKEKKPGS